MKLFFYLIFLSFGFSSYSQQDALKPKHLQDSIAPQEVARKKFIARRDSIVTEVSKDLKIPKGKLEEALTAFAVTAQDLQQVLNNEDLTNDQRSLQLKVIAERRETTLKSLLTAEQVDKIKGYIVRRKIPKKVE